jgi:hypothetical protein
MSQPGKEVADAVASYDMCMVIHNLTELQAMFKATLFGLFHLTGKKNGPACIISNHDK